jgi:hypothetical protein
MGRGANRRKITEPFTVVASTSTSGTTLDSDNAANADSVIFYALVSAVTGSVTFTIQSSPDDGTNWYTLTTAETVGNTGALAATGNYHISTQVPFGTRLRLAYTIVTGPVAFLGFACYSKSGSVY